MMKTNECDFVYYKRKCAPSMSFFIHVLMNS